MSLKKIAAQNPHSYASLLDWSGNDNCRKLNSNILPSTQVSLSGETVIETNTSKAFKSKPIISIEDRKRALAIVMDENFAYQCPKNSVVGLISLYSKIRKQKYIRSTVPKYGSPNAKRMRFDQVEKLLRAFRPEHFKFKALFEVMAWTGMRVGEAVQLNLKDIHWEERIVSVNSEKKHWKVTQQVAMVDKLKDLLTDYIEIYDKQIAAHNGFFFFTDRKSRIPHILPECANRIFALYRKETGLDFVYAKREPRSGLDFIEGEQHNYTPNSLRNVYCHYLRKKGLALEERQLAMRHVLPSTTQIYDMPDPNEIATKVRQAFAVQKIEV